MYCKNCEFWHNERYDISHINQSKTLVQSRVGVCIESQQIDYWSGWEEIETVLLSGKIGGDNIYTDAEFGCIHFFEKQNK